MAAPASSAVGRTDPVRPLSTKDWHAFPEAAMTPRDATPTRTRGHRSEGAVATESHQRHVIRSMARVVPHTAKEGRVMVKNATNISLTFVCCLSQFLHNVYGSAINMALPAISKDLGAGVESLQWLVSAYIIALASMLTFAGTLADRWGRKRVLALGNLVMVIGAVVCALSDAVPWLIVGRVIQGIGSALIAPAGLSLLTAAFPQVSAKAVAVMWWTTVGTASLAAGPILGGLLVRDFGWQSIFWAGVPLGLLALVLGVVLLRESRSDAPDPFDPLGQLLLTVLLATLAFTLIEGVHLGWTSPAVLVCACAAVVSLVMLVPVELRKKYPLIPVRLFRRASFSTGLVTAVLGYLALAALLFLNTFYLQAERGLDASSAGLMTLPLAGGATASALLAARFVEKNRSRLALLISGALMTVGAVALWATESAPLWTVILPYLVFGFGFGLIADPVSVTALSSLPPEEAGLASSLISTSKQVGQMLGIALAGTLLAAAAGTSEATEFTEMGGWVWALLVSAGLAIVALNIRRRKARAART
ncbi:MFS transporter [Microbacterium caowuchunii]|nr:MFS transporter [Microbacterium caowuchunii]